MMTIILTALATLFVTVLAGLALDYLRHGRPKVSYAIKDAVPIELQGKHIGAYLVSLDNVSKKVVRELTCHIQAQPAKLRNGGITAPQGLQYSVSDLENGLQIAIPYLNKADSLQMTVIAESVLYIPKTPDVALRSPNEGLIVVARQSETVPKSFKGGFFTAAVVATLVSGIITAIFPYTGSFQSQKDVLTFAASVAGLPRLAESYALASEPHYYHQGDLAYALAAESNDRKEIEKYRKLIAVILELGESRDFMLWSSRANLRYSLGKLDLLLGDKESAIRNFRAAISASKWTVEAKAKVDATTREFLRANAIL